MAAGLQPFTASSGFVTDPSITYYPFDGDGSDNSGTAAFVSYGSANWYYATNGYLRNIIGHASSIITIGHQGTTYWNTIDLIPGRDGKIRMYSDDGSESSSGLTMTIDDQMVGIGTTSPEDKLHISKGNLIFDQLGNQTSGDFSNHSKILWRDEADSTTRTMAGIGAVRTAWSNSPHALVFYTGDLTGSSSEDYDEASERMRIDHEGNVMVGSTASIMDDSLTDAHSLTVYNSTTRKRAVLELASGSSTDTDVIGSIFFSNSDNADATNFDLNSKMVASIEAYVETDDSNAGDDSGADLAFITKPNAGPIVERMRITSAGNVGIGTTDPDTHLHVEGSGIQRIRVESTDDQAGIELISDSADSWIMYSPDGTDDLRFYRGADKVVIDSTGNVEIDGGLKSTSTTNGWGTWQRYQFRRDGVGTTTNNLRLLMSPDDTSTTGWHPMPVGGTIRACTVKVWGASLSASATNQTFAVQFNNYEGTNQVVPFTKKEETFTVSPNQFIANNSHGTNYSYTATGLSLAFVAGDALGARREGGSVDLGNIMMDIWVSFDS